MKSVSTTTPSPLPVAAASFAAGIASLYFYNRFSQNVAAANGNDATTTTRPSRRRSEIDAMIPDWLLRSNPTLSVNVLNHLTRVYATLGAAVLAATSGAMVQMRMGGNTTLAQLVSLGLAFSLSHKATMWKLLGYGFFQGMSLGGILKLALAIDASIIPLALGSSTAILLSFAAAATLATRRSFLYAYGILGSTLTVLGLTSLANLYFKSKTLFNLQLYGGLAMFTGFVAADSQLIIELSESGERNYVQHAWMLFTDLGGIFVRMLYIFMDNAQQQQRRKKERRRGGDDDDAVDEDEIRRR